MKTALLLDNGVACTWVDGLFEVIFVDSLFEFEEILMLPSINCFVDFGCKIDALQIGFKAIY
jgi:hypothetical protein